MTAKCWWSLENYPSFSRLKICSSDLCSIPTFNLDFFIAISIFHKSVDSVCIPVWRPCSLMELELSIDTELCVSHYNFVLGFHIHLALHRGISNHHYWGIMLINLLWAIRKDKCSDAIVGVVDINLCPSKFHFSLNFPVDMESISATIEANDWWKLAAILAIKLELVCNQFIGLSKHRNERFFGSTLENPLGGWCLSHECSHSFVWILLLGCFCQEITKSHCFSSFL